MKFLVLSLLFFSSPVFHPSRPPANVGDDFQGIDFKNWSYPYRFAWGKHVHIPLKNGNYRYDFRTERGWFDVSHVYVTHLICGVSCDGGSALFYIYSFDNHRLKPLWQYETGDLAYGCGLKSFTARGGTLTVDLFGRCSPGNQTASSTGKFQVKDFTRVTFKSNGTRFVVAKRQFYSLPERNVLNYEPQIDVAQ